MNGLGSSMPSLGAGMGSTAPASSHGVGFPWQQFGSGIGDILGGLFGSNKNPADAAMGYLNQISGTMQPYYNPYITAGRNALGTLQGQYNTLLQDPTAMMRNIGKTFQQSPGYQFQVNQALNAANRAAAAGGMAGSPMEQQNIASTVNDLANQDYYHYLNAGLGQYGQGLSGMGGINQMGFQASDELAKNLAQVLMSQANAAYSGQANENQSQGGMMGMLGGGLGTLLGGLSGSGLLSGLFV